MAWSRYGGGLWDESWAEFFGNLARAVQPYAHYTADLMGWQLATVAHGGTGTFVAVVGPGTYGALKASRLTLLHILCVWTLGRLLVENAKPLGPAVRAEQMHALGAALSRSRLLVRTKDWGPQLWPHLFFKPGRDWHDS